MLYRVIGVFPEGSTDVSRLAKWGRSRDAFLWDFCSVLSMSENIIVSWYHCIHYYTIIKAHINTSKQAVINVPQSENPTWCKTLNAAGVYTVSDLFVGAFCSSIAEEIFYNCKTKKYAILVRYIFRRHTASLLSPWWSGGSSPFSEHCRTRSLCKRCFPKVGVVGD